MTRLLVELSVATSIPFQTLAELPTDVLQLYVDTLNRRK